MTAEGSGQEVRLDIVMQNGAVMLTGGLPLPKIRGRIAGELRTPVDAFENPEVARLMSDPQIVELLQAGVQVLVGVRSQSIPPSLDAFARPLPPAQVRDAWRGDLRWIDVILNEPLLWPVGGGGRQLLLDCKCSIPALGKGADSLNHAYTLVSTTFEPARRSHTGNVFLRAYYQTQGGLYAPLDELRQRADSIWGNHLRFVVLLDALGIRDLAQRSSTMQPKLFFDVLEPRQEIARLLQPFSSMLADAHDRCRAFLCDVSPLTHHLDGEGFWQETVAFARAISHVLGIDLITAVLPEMIGELVCRTQEALTRFDLFNEPDLQNLLSYAVGVLTFIWQEGLTGLVDFEKASQERVIANPGERCDLCSDPLSNKVYFIDGAVQGAGMWANMCPQCYFKHGRGIRWGAGQLYMRQVGGSWLMVAGFRPDDTDYSRTEAG